MGNITLWGELPLSPKSAQYVDARYKKPDSDDAEYGLVGDGRRDDSDIEMAEKYDCADETAPKECKSLCDMHRMSHQGAPISPSLLAPPQLQMKKKIHQTPQKSMTHGPPGRDQKRRNEDM